MKSGKLTPEEKKRLRDKIPKLDFAAVRRIRLPFHEALMLELQEGQFNRTYEFFSELVQIDLSSESKILTMGKASNKALIERIFDELKKTEQGDNEQEIKILLQLAKSVNNFTWLAEKIYVRAIVMVRNYDLDGTRSDAIAQYFYGKFLNESKERLQEAVSYLETALEMSYGVEHWFDDIDSEEKDVQLDILIAIQYCKSLLNLSKLNRVQSPQDSFELAKKSLKITQKFENEKVSFAEVQSLIEIGNCYSAMRNNEKALSHYQVAFDLADLRGFYEIGFEALMKISESYKESNLENYENTLNRGNEYAGQHLLVDLKGGVLVQLAKHEIRENKLDKAYEHLEESSRILVDRDETVTLREVRMLMAPLIGKFSYFSNLGSNNSLLHQAMQSFNRVVDTILKSDKEMLGQNTQQQRLILWYDRKLRICNPQHALYMENDLKLETFIQKLYNPDEITRVNDA